MDATPSMTRTEKLRIAIPLVAVWVLLLAVVAQNHLRQTATAQPIFTPHSLLVYVTPDSIVYTLAEGVATPHVPLQQCADRSLVMTRTDDAPIVLQDRLEWTPVEKAWRLTATASYAILTTNTSLDLLFADGARVSFGIECPPRSSDAHYAMIFWNAGTVYLADMTSGTAAPLFMLEDHCQLAWSKGDTVVSAFPWELSLPLYTGDGDIPANSLIATTFTTNGQTQLNMTDSQNVRIISDSGVVTVYSDCGTPVMMPRPAHW